jgi:hypothetical protein
MVGNVYNLLSEKNATTTDTWLLRRGFSTNLAKSHRFVQKRPHDKLFIEERCNGSKDVAADRVGLRSLLSLRFGQGQL